MSAKAKSTASSPKPVTTPNPLKSELGTSRNTSRSPKSRNSNRSPKRSHSPNKSKLKKDSIHDEVPIEENKTTVEEDEFETEENKITNPIVEEQPEVEEPLVNHLF